MPTRPARQTSNDEDGECPFQHERLDEDGAVSIQSWWDLMRPDPRLDENQYTGTHILMANRIEEYDRYLTHRIAQLNKAGLHNAAALVRSMQKAFRDLFCW